MTINPYENPHSKLKNEIQLLWFLVSILRLPVKKNKEILLIQGLIFSYLSYKNIKKYTTFTKLHQPHQIKTKYTSYTNYPKVHLLLKTSSIYTKLHQRNNKIHQLNQTVQSKPITSSYANCPKMHKPTSIHHLHKTTAATTYT